MSAEPQYKIQFKREAAKLPGVDPSEKDIINSLFYLLAPAGTPYGGGIHFKSYGLEAILTLPNEPVRVTHEDKECFVSNHAGALRILTAGRWDTYGVLSRGTWYVLSPGQLWETRLKFVLNSLGYQVVPLADIL